MKIRTEIQNGDFPKEIREQIINSYLNLSSMYKDAHGNPQNYTDVAVRSSGTAEDMPDASFAGQQETYLNVSNYHLCELYVDLSSQPQLAYA